MKRLHHTRTVKVPTEAQIQRATIDLLAWDGRPDAFAFHVPLGGYRRKTEAAILKSIGTIAGVPDIIIIFEGRVFCLELKSEHGKLTGVQRVCHERLRRAGATVDVAFGLEQAIAQLQTWNLLRGRMS